MSIKYSFELQFVTDRAWNEEDDSYCRCIRECFAHVNPDNLFIGLGFGDYVNMVIRFSITLIDEEIDDLDMNRADLLDAVKSMFKDRVGDLCNELKISEIEHEGIWDSCMIEDEVL